MITQITVIKNDVNILMFPFIINESFETNYFRHFKDNRYQGNLSSLCEL